MLAGLLQVVLLSLVVLSQAAPAPPRILWNVSKGFGGVYGQPAVFEELGLVVVAHQTALAAYDAFSGSTVWSLTLLGGRQTSAVPHKERGLVYVGSWTGYVTCANASTGSVVWTFNTGGVVAVAPVVTRDAVYSASTSGAVRRHDVATGFVAWLTAGMGDVNSRGVEEGGAIFFGAEGPAYANSLFALRTRDGSLIWKGSSSPNPFSERLEVAGGVIYSGNYGGQVQATVAADGTVLWTANESEGWTSPCYYNGNVYAARGDGLEELDASSGGQVYHTVLLSSITYSSPVQYRGTIYLCTGSDNPVLAAVTAEDGMVQWQLRLQAAGATVAVADTAVAYVGDLGGTVYAVSLKG